MVFSRNLCSMVQHSSAWTCLTPRLTHWQPGVEMHKEAPDLRQLSGQLPPLHLPVLGVITGHGGPKGTLSMPLKRSLG